MKKLLTFKTLLVLLMVLIGTKSWGYEISLTYEDFENTIYSNSESTISKSSIDFGHVQFMRNGTNGTPQGWAKDQVIQAKKSDQNTTTSLYNKTSLGKITNIRVYLVVNTNAFYVSFGSTREVIDGQLSRPTTETGTVDMQYTTYAKGGVTSTSSTEAKYYDFDLSGYNASYFKIINGSGALYIPRIVITYEDGGSTPTEPEEKTLIGIEATGTPTEFWKGDAFNHNGITVTALWDDETETDVTSSCEFSGYNMSTAGEQTVTVTYQGETCNYKINVKTIANTQETAYTAAEAIALINANKDLATQVYVKGTVSSIVTEYSEQYGNITFNIEDGFQFYRNQKTAQYKYTEDPNIKVGDYVVGCGTLTKHEASSTYEFAAGNYLVKHDKVATLSIADITVADGEDITPVITTNVVGEYAIEYTSDNEEVVLATGDEMVTMGVGTATITATLVADGYKDAETTFNVTVTSNATLSSVTLSGELTNTTYTIGDTFDHTGLVATANYSDDSHVDVTETATWEVDPETLTTAGTVTVTVSASFGGQEDIQEYEVTVNKKTASIIVEDITVEVGKTATIEATTTPADAALTYTITEGADKISISEGVITGVAEGTATVTANYAGNDEYNAAEITFTVTVIKIQKFEIAWMVNGAELEDETKEYVEGSSITAPENPKNIADYKFVGWAKNKHENVSDEDIVNFETEAATADATYYAVFAKMTGTNEGYTKANSLNDGDQVILALEGNNNQPTIGVFGADENKKDASVNDTESNWMKFTVDVIKIDNTTKTVLKNADSKYISQQSNNFRLVDDVNNATSFYVTNNSELENKNNTDYYRFARNYSNGNSYYRFYKTTTLLTENNSYKSNYTPFYVWTVGGTSYSDYTTIVNVQDREFYLNHTWGGTDAWWNKLTPTGDGTYSLNAVCGNNYNEITVGSNNKSAQQSRYLKEEEVIPTDQWDLETITHVGEVTADEPCTFTYNPVGNVLTIIPKDNTYYVYNNWKGDGYSWRPLGRANAEGTYSTTAAFYTTEGIIVSTSIPEEGEVLPETIHTSINASQAAVWDSSTKKENTYTYDPVNKVLTIKANSIVTGIDDITVNSAVKAYKVIENGQVIIVRGDQRFNIMGQPVR